MSNPSDSLVIITGADYVENSTGRIFRLEGLRSKQRVCMIHDAKGPNREVKDYLTLPELKEQFSYNDCNHETHCCTHHKTHTMPHMHCMFR